jgi:hypothetical protein
MVPTPHARGVLHVYSGRRLVPATTEPTLSVSELKVTAVNPDFKPHALVVMI